MIGEEVEERGKGRGGKGRGGERRGGEGREREGRGEEGRGGEVMVQCTQLMKVCKCTMYICVPYIITTWEYGNCSIQGFRST